MYAANVNATSDRPYPADVRKNHPAPKAPNFPQHLAALRKEKSLTQQQLADSIEVSVGQFRRYESGSSQPTLDVIRKMAMALSVTSDRLLFGTDERGPDDDLRLQFEAVTRFSTEEKKVVKSVLEGMILKHEARRWNSDRE
jgi:transcriptional regulator with XRE-family HTH domain